MARDKAGGSRREGSMQLTSKSLSESGDKCLLAITSARRTSVKGVDLNDLTEPTMPVALGGLRTRMGTLMRFHTGKGWPFLGRRPAG